MPILNFKEIPEAHKGGGEQDTFEQFTREFLEYLGFQVLTGPSRGADLGRDLVVEETRTGPGGNSIIRHLVSCKHKAHSGTAVLIGDEPDVRDRLATHQCDAFIGVYSTIPSTSLLEKLSKQSFEARTFDCRQIEKELLRREEGLHLAKRYFPQSVSQWIAEDTRPAELGLHVPLKCDVCGRDLLQKLTYPGFIGGVVGFVTPLNKLQEEAPPIVDIDWYCKGQCAITIEERLRKKGRFEDGWEDIEDFRNPHTFITGVSSLFDEIHRMTENAREKLTYFLHAVFPYVSRPLTSEEKKLRDRLRKMFENS